ncbi:hypothetical protein [Ferruginibacter albus]|uniref:hypothetical protein n=1 Tax=Ferruginibacter albus TaxID=2875540 RepID=UPI001CC39136|nr:hypothetical protein [Ferruginibacter albus]UAY53123.1 hypothetical protein K9M53_05465 [Ferruginibacter albus]
MPSLFKKWLTTLTLFIASISVNAQATNSIDIGSALQNTDTATTLNPWIVTNMTDHMKNAICVGNSDAWNCPYNTTPILPVAIGANAILIDPLIDGNGNYPWPAGSYLSCFNANTIYTPPVTQSNSTACAMTISRRFIVNTAANTENITFKFTINVDNEVNAIVLDEGTANAINVPFTYSNVKVSQQVTIDTTIILSNGMHTVDITCANGEMATGGRYCYTMNNWQMNPFGITIRGNISSNADILVNSKSSPVTTCRPCQDSCNKFNTVVTNLENRVTKLENALKALLNIAANCPPIVASNTCTLDISPVPFSNATTVNYAIQNFSGNGILQVTDLSGNLLKSYPISQENGQMAVTDISGPDAVLIFSIVSNNKVLISKKSIRIN